MTIKCLGDITRFHRAERPDKVAMIYTDDDREWTFRELDEEACRCANALAGLGIGSQDRIAYLDKNTPEYFTCLFGAAKINAVSVAVNWRLAPPEIEYILNHSESKVLLIGDAFLPCLNEMTLNLDQIVVLGDPGATGYPTYKQWILDQPTSDPQVAASPEETCCQLYTSGTTGLPKGVETTHNNLLGLMGEGLNPIRFSSASVSLVCMPVFHIAGSGWGIFGFFTGAETILLKEADAQEILRSIPKHRITHSVFVPAILQFLLDQPNIDDIDFSSIQSILYGASPISEKVLVKAMEIFQADFFQVYGLTETTGGVTMLLHEDHDPGGPKAHLLRSCGQPIGEHEMKIVDTETEQQVGDGEIGEIWLRGPQIMRGYWRNDEATRESIDQDGWFRSGDAGYVIDGYLFIHDRVKDMIISGGENIYPAEIENVLMKHPGVADAAVIGVPDEQWGETVKAIITRVNEQVREEDIFSFCRKNLAHFKCPTSFAWMDEIPRNPTGKILKTELRKPYWKGKKRMVS